MASAVLLLPAITAWAPPSNRTAAAAGPSYAPGLERPDEAGGADLRVYLVTVEPGDKLVSKFGHTAIWISDEAEGRDVAYNFGQSQVGARLFVRQILWGSILSWITSYDLDAMLLNYARQNRSVWVQELNLAPPQRTALRDYLEWKTRPENAFYVYDFFLGNCTTGVRDAVDRVLGGQIANATSGVPSPNTYRSEVRRYTRDDPFLDMALTLGMATYVDRPISIWEEMFLPGNLRARFGEIMIRDALGDSVPLVLGEELRIGSVGRRPSAARRDGIRVLWVGVTLGAVLALLGGTRLNRLAVSRGVFFAVAETWLLLAGTAGMMLGMVWFWADQNVTRGNENLLLFNPAALVTGVMILGAGRTVVAARYLAVALAIGSGVGACLDLLSKSHQENAEILALAVPINVGLAWGLWFVSSPKRRRPESS